MRMNEKPTLYSRVCFNISSSSRVKFSSTDTARISWNAWWSKTHGFTTSLYMELLWHHLQLRFQTRDKDTQFDLLTSASRDDMNLRTTCLRYSKLISRESLRSAVLVTLVLKVGRFWEDAGGGSGKTLSCLSARISGDFSRASASGSDFSLYNGFTASACTVSSGFFMQNAVVGQSKSEALRVPTSSFCSVLFSSAILCCSCLMVCNVIGQLRGASTDRLA